MLVLARKKHEKLMIGDGIVVEILDITGNKVRLGVTAPSHIVVHREEALNPKITYDDAYADLDDS